MHSRTRNEQLAILRREQAAAWHSRGTFGTLPYIRPTASQPPTSYRMLTPAIRTPANARDGLSLDDTHACTPHLRYSELSCLVMYLINRLFSGSKKTDRQS